VEPFFRKLIYRHRGQRVACAGLLAVLVLPLLGVPISVSRPIASRESATDDQRYPCESHPCGCVSAHYCWDRCCCMSDSEKLRWAKRNDITPPAFLLARVNQSTLSDGGSACQITTSPARRSCCSGSAHSSQSSAANADSDQPTDRVSVLYWEAARCQGLQWNTATCGCLVVPLSTLRWRSDPPLIARLLPSNEVATSFISGLDPPIP